MLYYFRSSFNKVFYKEKIISFFLNMKNSEKSIFEIINPFENDIISDMNDSELKDFLFYLNNYYLALRDELNFSHKITFGFEIEAENCMFDIIKDEINKFFNNTWSIQNDASLKSGIEVISPILNNVKNTYENLKKICTIINSNANILENAGSHIHIGAQIFNNNMNAIINFIKLWAVYENVIFRFVYGEYLNNRPNIEKYSSPLKNKFLEDYNLLKGKEIFKSYDILDVISCDKNQSINFENVKSFSILSLKNTIEFRCPNGTLNPVIWQNNLNLFVHLIKYSLNEFNLDIIERRENLIRDITIESYNKIFLEQAIELSDMIFKNNIDKIYFLRQYLKTFEINNKSMVKAKTFTTNN